MSGKKITREAYARIAAVGEDTVLGRIAAGETMTAIAASLGVSRPLLSAWANHGSRADAYARARRQGAAALAEQALQIADRTVTPDEVPAAKLQVDTRKWLASRLDPAEWGEQRGALVNIQVTDLHLESLRQIRVIEGDQGEE